mmetsp:Transcript_7193/g.10589  ORF Transcript_7193/g.10589 Transcript_7193/m.10589 type:complete len:454 (+) Transcript_7193:672-2033(+)
MCLINVTTAGVGICTICHTSSRTSIRSSGRIRSTPGGSRNLNGPTPQIAPLQHHHGALSPGWIARIDKTEGGLHHHLVHVYMLREERIDFSFGSIVTVSAQVQIAIAVLFTAVILGFVRSTASVVTSKGVGGNGLLWWLCMCMCMCSAVVGYSRWWLLLLNMCLCLCLCRGCCTVVIMGTTTVYGRSVAILWRLLWCRIIVIRGASTYNTRSIAIGQYLHHVEQPGLVEAALSIDKAGHEGRTGRQRVEGIHVGAYQEGGQAQCSYHLWCSPCWYCRRHDLWWLLWLLLHHGHYSCRSWMILWHGRCSCLLWWYNGHLWWCLLYFHLLGQEKGDHSRRRSSGHRRHLQRLLDLRQRSGFVWYGLQIVIGRSEQCLLHGGHASGFVLDIDGVGRLRKRGCNGRRCFPRCACDAGNHGVQLGFEICRMCPLGILHVFPLIEELLFALITHIASLR